MISKLEKLGYLVGIIIIIASVMRWYVLYLDYSTLILYVGVGCIIMAGSLIYGWIRRLESEVEEMNKKIDGLNKWITKEEWKD